MYGPLFIFSYIQDPYTSDHVNHVKMGQEILKYVIQRGERELIPISQLNSEEMFWNSIS